MLVAGTMFYTAFFDINDNGLDIADITAVGVFLTVFTGILLAVGHLLLRKLDQRIDSRLQVYTSLIQPTSNTGTGLPDLTDSVATIAEHLGIAVSVKRRVPDEAHD